MNAEQSTVNIPKAHFKYGNYIAVQKNCVHTFLFFNQFQRRRWGLDLFYADNCSVVLEFVDNVTSVWSSIVSFPIQNVHCLFIAKVSLASGFVTPAFCISDNETVLNVVAWRFTPFHNNF